MEGKHQWGAFLKNIVAYMQVQKSGIRVNLTGDPKALEAMRGIATWFGMSIKDYGPLEEGAERTELGNCCGKACCAKSCLCCSCPMAAFLCSATNPFILPFCPRLCWKMCYCAQWMFPPPC